MYHHSQGVVRPGDHPGGLHPLPCCRSPVSWPNATFSLPEALYEPGDIYRAQVTLWTANSLGTYALAARANLVCAPDGCGCAPPATCACGCKACSSWCVECMLATSAKHHCSATPNTYSLVCPARQVVVTPKGDGCEEFWAMNPSGRLTNTTCGGISTGEPYREVGGEPLGESVGRGSARRTQRLARHSSQLLLPRPGQGLSLPRPRAGRACTNPQVRAAAPPAGRLPLPPRPPRSASTWTASWRASPPSTTLTTRCAPRRPRNVQCEEMEH